MNDKHLFRAYDTKAKIYLLANFNTKQKAKKVRNDNEYALPHFEGTTFPPNITIKQDKHYKYRFQTRRAKDHRKGES